MSAGGAGRAAAWACRRPSPLFTEAYGDLVERLARLRREAGLSQRELAGRIGRSPSHVARIERRQRRIEVLELHAIALALGRDPPSLFLEVAELIGSAGAET